MGKKKVLCHSCDTMTFRKRREITFSMCEGCGSWGMPSLDKALAIVMAGEGFDWHAFADTIDKMREEAHSGKD